MNSAYFVLSAGTISSSCNFKNGFILVLNVLIGKIKCGVWHLTTKYDSNFKYYAIFSGDQSLEEKADILSRLNKDENKHGELISILLISKSGTEGLDLKNVRSIHIIEPFWNFSVIQQVIARGVRYKSHIALPEDERNVQTYIYLSDYNKEMLDNEKLKIKENKKNKKKLDKIEITTDISMFRNCINKVEWIKSKL